MDVANSFGSLVAVDDGCPSSALGEARGQLGYRAVIGADSAPDAAL